LTRRRARSSRTSERSGRQSHNVVRRTEYSVIVVGGGPAGLATAIELSALGISALVVERSSYDDIRIGEHLSPPALLSLRAISPESVLQLEGHAISAGVEAYWGSENASCTDYFLHPVQHGLNLTRPRFDADLAAVCERAGVAVLRSAVLTGVRNGNPDWQVDVAVDGEARGFFASVVVDATGRSASFARSQGARLRAHDRQVAIVGFGHDPGGEAPRRSLVEAGELGWWYCAAIGSDQRICMFVTDADLMPKGSHAGVHAWWRDQLCRTTQVACRFGNSRLSDRLHIRSARSQRLDPFFGRGWLAVGDAAMAFDPIASQGIAKALAHGKLAAAAIASHLAGDASPLGEFLRNREQEYMAYRAKRADYYRIEMRWPQSAFWKRRHEEAGSLH
jgi:flavin-dependent dehydrogenase